MLAFREKLGELDVAFPDEKARDGGMSTSGR